MSANTENATKHPPILIHDSDLPLYCPGPKAPLWSMHPRVYIEIGKAKEATCPYCSAHYVLEPEGVTQAGT